MSFITRRGAARCAPTFLSLVAATIALLTFPVHLMAQSDLPNPLPLVGPLIAVDTAEQDRIVLYDVGDSNASRGLSFGRGLHHVWDFSPDGCRILFTLSNGTDPARLYSARLDGSDMRDLVQYADLPADQWGVWEPVWSPDGSRIAFSLLRLQTGSDGQVQRDTRIAWIPADGGAAAFYSYSGDDHSPQWSPIGQWLVYVVYEDRVPGAGIYLTAEPTRQPSPGQSTSGQPAQSLLHEGDLWLVSADGESRYRLTNLPTGSAGMPRWSPDGELVSFVYSPTPGNDQFWMIAGRAGSIPTKLSDHWTFVMDTTWLPDSTAILAAVREFHDLIPSALWRIPLVGNADTDASRYLNDDSLNYADYPRFSADGHWLALRTAYALTLIDTAAQSWSLVDEQNLADTAPVWSPAGFTGESNCK
jgi:Tol biopolymer transport system component